MFIDCTDCRNGRIVEEGFDGRTARQCQTCHGAGEIELNEEETRIMESFLAECAAGLDAIETVAEIEETLRVAPATPLPALVHEGMTPKFFDAAIKRAYDAGLSISRTLTPNTVAVNSGTDDSTYYNVTRETCQCIGHERLGRCYHRAFACFYWWLQECDAVAAAAHTPELVAA